MLTVETFELDYRFIPFIVCVSINTKVSKLQIQLVELLQREKRSPHCISAPVIENSTATNSIQEVLLSLVIVFFHCFESSSFIDFKLADIIFALKTNNHLYLLHTKAVTSVDTVPFACLEICCDTQSIFLLEHPWLESGFPSKVFGYFACTHCFGQFCVIPSLPTRPYLYSGLTFPLCFLSVDYNAILR